MSIVSKLLLASLAAVVISVVLVQLWTLHVVSTYQTKAAQHTLDSDISLLVHSFGRQQEWARDGSGHLMLNGRPVDGAADAVHTVRDITGADATIFDGDIRIATTLSGVNGRSLIGSHLAAGPVRDQVLGQGRSYTGTTAIMGTPYLTSYKPILGSRGEVLGILFVGTKLTDASEVMRRIVRESLIIGLVVILAVGVVRGLALRSSMRPLTMLAASVRKIAAGDLENETPCADRTDQLGDIGRAIETLRHGARAARDIEAKAQLERAGRDRSQSAIDQLTHDFATTISGVLAKLGHSAGEVRQAAGVMTDVANKTRSDMLGAADDAETSAQNLSSVAAATDELTANGNEISRQIGQVSTATELAVTQAQTAARTVEGLDEMARQINAVVGLISQIAGQTNLLALNATIEAARAGDAGKGFAVVASEVKQLAAQTNQATARIGEQIAAIQAATTDVVAAVGNVSSAISQAGQVAATIASSVGEQGAATQEIAMQVQTVSQATVNANRAMRGASDLAAQSADRSRSVLATADQVAAVTATLQAEVGHFLAATSATLFRCEPAD